jgi:hypothetical protein
MMKRACFTVIVACVVLGIAVLAAGKATWVSYSLTAQGWFMENPYDYLTHQADGWYLVKDLPIGGFYSQDLGGEVVEAILSANVDGILSVDFADANFHGSVTLSFENSVCSGYFTATRVNYFETGNWVLQCSDGSKIHDWYHFPFGEPPWPVDGHGMRLIPQD